MFMHVNVRFVCKAYSKLDIPLQLTRSVSLAKNTAIGAMVKRLVFPLGAKSDHRELSRSPAQPTSV